nr:hypothetical protein [Tanacetum cinerariifolium]
MHRPRTTYQLPLPVVRDTIELETAVTTISQEYLLEFTSEYGISEALHPKLPSPEDRIVDFPEGKARPRGYDDTEHTSYPNPETTRSTTLLSRVEPQILPGRRDMDLFNLIRAPNPTKVKTSSRPRAAHEVSLLTVTANRVIEMEDPTATTDSSGVPSTIEMYPLDFANENPSQQSTGLEDQEAVAPEVPPLENVTTTRAAPEAGQVKRVAATSPPMVKECCKRGHNGVDTNTPPKVLRRDHADPRPTESTRGRKSLAVKELGIGSNRPVLASQGAPVDVSDPDPLSFANPQSRPSADVTQFSMGAAAAGDLESENTSFTSMIGYSESIYRPEWAIQCKLGTASGNGVAAAVKVSTLQEHVMGEGKLKAAFEEFKQNEDNWVEQRCAELDARLDALSICFDEELYPHMLTAIAGRRWVIGRGLRLAVMKCEAPDPMDPWACKEEILLADAIAANVSHAEKKKKCRVVCRTHGICSAHHARSDGVPVSVPTVVPQGLAILLADAATQTKISEDEASPRLLRSSSLPAMHS